MGIFKLKLENLLYEFEVNLSWFVVGFSSSQAHGGHSRWLVAQPQGGGGARRNHRELRPHELALPPRWRIGAGASSDDLHGAMEGNGEHQAWRRGVEQKRCAERARHSRRVRGVPGNPRRCLGRRWVKDGRATLPAWWWSDLRGWSVVAALGGEVLGRERERKREERKKR